jgi:hypothetical protein
VSAGKVDVLAVFDLLRQLAQQNALYGPSVDDSADCARAAVAELIEAARDAELCFSGDERWWEDAHDRYMCGNYEGSDVRIRNSEDVRALIAERLRAALAKVQP